VTDVVTARAARRGPRARHAHRVQFYDREEHLHEVVATYAAGGLADEAPVVIIARPSNRRALEDRLRAAGHDVDAARRSGQLRMLDAAETLGRIMVDGTPSWDLFRQQVGSVVEECALLHPGRLPRAYGEMVDVLYREGNQAAALRLEDFWNDLGQLRPFTLLCAYAMDNFREAADGSGLEQVCLSHGDVEPSESFQAEAGAVGLNRQVVLLQQRARALETELGHRRQLESELWRQNALLSRTAGFSEMFMSALSYDLRSPLLAMVTAAGLMFRRSDPEEITRLAQRIVSSAGRMDRMIDQLLDFTRLRMGQGLSLGRRNVDLRPLCREVVDEVEAMFEGEAVLIDSRGDASGFWDRGHLEQLMFTLVGNAVAHGDPDRPVTLDLDGTARDQVVLEVHNAGEIPPELQPSLYEPFKPPEARRLVGGRGLGLGLCLAEQIVRAHGGDIGFVSSRAEGTRFRVSLPRVVALA
jgi:signal transduction histidine kinase